MVKTPNSTINQVTVGPVPVATEPTDPVPLSQAGAVTIWVNDRGVLPQIAVSKQTSYSWDAKIIDLTDPAETPFRSSPYSMRLKEIRWVNSRNHSLNIVRNNRVIATVPSGPRNEFNFLYEPGDQLLFTTSDFIRLQTSWSLIIRWELLVPFVVYIPTEVKSEIENEPLELDIEEREVKVQSQIVARPKRKLTERIMSVFKRG